VRAWRICKLKFITLAFGGEGAFRYGGRWNSRGGRVVYLGGNPSICALELMVNTDEAADLYRIPYVIIPVDFDETLLTRPLSLPEDWNEYPPPPSCAALGDHWLAGGRTAILEIPSAVISLERNFILNPLHQDFDRVKIGKPQKFEFDSRLVKLWSSKPVSK
jgi:RES domain-containing protein